MSKSKPIPVRFEQAEADAIELLHKRTKLTRADIIRRAIRLLEAEVKRRGQVGFILDLEDGPDNVVQGTTYSAAEERTALRAAEDPPPHPSKASARRASGK